MVRIRKIEIVSIKKILTEEEINETEFREDDFNANMRVSEEMIDFMAMFGLIRNPMVCSICLTSMSLVRSYRKQSIKGWVCLKPCNKTCPPRTNLF